jgi:tripartite-type tricarboxylate transporter receptor subunit TctC
LLDGCTLPCRLVASALGQASPDFYRNKQIRLVVGYASGNDYDIGARVLAKYLPRYIPGQPSIIVQNMPQAASLVAANYVYAQAPRSRRGACRGARRSPGRVRLARPVQELCPPL